MWDGENQFLQLHTSWAQLALFVFQAAGFMTVHWCSDWGCWDRRMSIHENGFVRDTWGLRKRSERESRVQATLWIQWEREREKKKDYSSHQATVYELERYLLSSVPNQVLNSPSSQLNDACNRTRLQHGADRTTEKPEGHLDICSAARLTFTKRPESSFPLPSFFTFFFFK